jgi:gas vesicle protein
MANENNDPARNPIAITFSAGQIVGTVVAILCALSESHQTRGKTEEFAEDVKGKTGQLSIDLKEKASSLLEITKEVREVNEEVPPSDFAAVKNEYVSEGESVFSPEVA